MGDRKKEGDWKKRGDGKREERKGLKGGERKG